MLTERDLQAIAKVPIFAALPPRALERVGELAHRVDITAARLIFAEGEPAKEMFVVLSGELEVRKRSQRGGDAAIATLRPGDVCGEMALIDIQPRSAAVWATGPASLMVLTYADVARFYEEDPDSYTLLVLNIAREISRRLRRLDRMMADMMDSVQDILVSHSSEPESK